MRGLIWIACPIDGAKTGLGNIFAPSPLKALIVGTAEVIRAAAARLGKGAVFYRGIRPWPNRSIEPRIHLGVKIFPTGDPDEAMTILAIDFSISIVIPSILALLESSLFGFGGVIRVFTAGDAPKPY
jgi:hypothetical protein